MVDDNSSEPEAINRLTKDLKKASQTMSKDEARFLVNTYYKMQDDRMRSTNQVRALSEKEVPHQTISWLADNAGILERQIKNALDSYSDASILGRWAKSICGIGPVITAGLLAHIEMEPWRCAVANLNPSKKVCNEKEPHGPACAYEKIHTAGHIWRFAGQDPTDIWEKGQKRPWNADLKTLVWKIGESFVKVSSNDADFYGKLYLERKVLEWSRNFAGELASQAHDKLEKFKIGKDTDAYAWYSGSLTVENGKKIIEAPAEKRISLLKKLAGEPGSGLAMLPPAHIHSRAKRWAVKIFLSHYHKVAYREHFGFDPPKPYIITKGYDDKGRHHTHEITVPNWPFQN